MTRTVIAILITIGWMAQKFTLVLMVCAIAAVGVLLANDLSTYVLSGAFFDNPMVNYLISFIIFASVAVCMPFAFLLIGWIIRLPEPHYVDHAQLRAASEPGRRKLERE